MTNEKSLFFLILLLASAAFATNVTTLDFRLWVWANNATTSTFTANDSTTFRETSLQFQHKISLNGVILKWSIFSIPFTSSGTLQNLTFSGLWNSTLTGATFRVETILLNAANTTMYQANSSWTSMGNRSLVRYDVPQAAIQTNYLPGYRIKINLWLNSSNASTNFINYMFNSTTNLSWIGIQNWTTFPDPYLIDPPANNTVLTTTTFTFVGDNADRTLPDDDCWFPYTNSSGSFNISAQWSGVKCKSDNAIYTLNGSATVRICSNNTWGNTNCSPIWNLTINNLPPAPLMLLQKIPGGSWIYAFAEPSLFDNQAFNFAGYNGDPSGDTVSLNFSVFINGVLNDSYNYSTGQQAANNYFTNPHSVGPYPAGTNISLRLLAEDQIHQLNQTAYWNFTVSGRYANVDLHFSKVEIINKLRTRTRTTNTTLISSPFADAPLVPGFLGTLIALLGVVGVVWFCFKNN